MDNDNVFEIDHVNEYTEKFGLPPIEAYYNTEPFNPCLFCYGPTGERMDTAIGRKIAFCSDTCEALARLSI